MTAPDPTFSDVKQAAETLRGIAVRTPVLENRALNERVGGRVLLKAECLQVIGAFKFRGAYNAVSQIDLSAFPGGVVACSSGNHAQGIAEAARRFAMPSVIVMPSDTPDIKCRGVREAGGEIVFYDRVTEDRDAISADLAHGRQSAFVHPFNNPRIIAGQGTVGLELVEQAREMGAELDAILVPVSGGGLVCGVALGAQGFAPDTAVHSVEPAGFDKLARSLAAGGKLANRQASGSICDALMAQAPGDITFRIAQQTLGAGISVPDDDILPAMRFAFERFKLVIEPGGAIALAAILSGHFDAKGRTVGIVISGGNVDPAVFARALATGD